MRLGVLLKAKTLMMTMMTTNQKHLCRELPWMKISGTLVRWDRPEVELRGWKLWMIQLRMFVHGIIRLTLPQGPPSLQCGRTIRSYAHREWHHKISPHQDHTYRQIPCPHQKFLFPHLRRKTPCRFQDRIHRHEWINLQRNRDLIALTRWSMT